MIGQYLDPYKGCIDCAETEDFRQGNSFSSGERPKEYCGRKASLCISPQIEAVDPLPYPLAFVPQSHRLDTDYSTEPNVEIATADSRRAEPRSKLRD